jgi:hypothetical protein
MKAVCTFTFPKDTARELIEAAIASAIFNAECAFGKPKVRISASYYVAKDSPQCVIDVSTGVGEHIAQIFTGIMINTLGEDKFQVKRIEGESVSARGNERS